ncbi:MAG: bifunctional phosphoglucose/phosphomannose isomerase [Candidatus Spechtbacterales bacterium]
MNEKNIDSYNMRQIILDFPRQFPVGYGAVGDAGKEFTSKEFKNIIIAGMGGSALAGEVLTLLSGALKLQLPVFIHRDYGLSSMANKNSLIVTLSYSGNTEETLSVYQAAKEKGITLAVITSDGSLKQMAKKDKKPLAIVPEGIPPRLAIGYQFSALLAILSNVGIIEPKEDVVQKISSELKSAEVMSLAKELVGEIKEKTPIIYSSKANSPLAYIMKIQINENAKRHAFYNSFPELNHNEILGYENSNPDNFFVFMLRDKNDHPKNQRRMEITARLLEKRKYKVKFIDIEGENMYNRAFNAILFGTWLSYYLAIQDSIDPTPVTLIKEIKRSLS